MNRSHRFSGGFTMIELMVVITVAAIMLSVAAPSFRSFVISQKVKTATNDFAMAITLARSEAIKRNANVSITAAASGATGWASGWSVTTPSGPSTTQVISNQAAYSDVSFSGPDTAIVYTGSGRLSAQVVPNKIYGSDGTIRCVGIDLSGMPRTTKIASGNCS